MIKIKGAKFHNGKLDDESMNKFKEGFNKEEKHKINKIVKLKKAEEKIEEKETEVLVK